MSAARIATLMTLVIVALMAIPAGGTWSPSTAVSPLHAAPTSAALAPAPRTSAASTDTWQEFQHDTSNSGLSPNSPVPATVVWNASYSGFANGPDAPFVSSPVSGQGDVYIAEGNTLVAYFANNGTLNWSTPLTGPANAVVDATPLLWRGMLFVSQDLGGFPPCGGPACSAIFVLNASDGKIAQSVATGTLGWGGAATSNSIVPLAGPDFGGQSGVLVEDHYGFQYVYWWNGTALQAAATNTANRVGLTRTSSTPSIAYLPGSGWANIILDGNAGSGSNVQAFQLGSAAQNIATNTNMITGYPFGPAIPGGPTMNWVGTNTGSVSIANLSLPGGPYPYGFFGDDQGAGTNSDLVALNLTVNAGTGSPTAMGVGALVSAGGVDSGVFSAPAIIPVNATTVHLLVTDLNGTISRWTFYAPANGLPGTLTMDWMTTLHGRVVASPSIATNVAYVGDAGGTFWAIDTGTGAVLWNHSFIVPIQGSVALSNGMAFVPASAASIAGRANLTAWGALGAPSYHLTIAATPTPSSVASGGTTTLQGTTTWVSTIGASGPAAGAFVNVTAYPNVGTFNATSLRANAQGVVDFGWTAPASSPVWYSVQFNITSWAPSNSTVRTSTGVSVAPGTSGGGGGVKALSLAVKLTASTLYAGASETVFFNVTSAGAPLAGATIDLAAMNYGSFSSAGPLTTGASGSVTDTFTAPSSSVLAVPEAAFVNATASAAGYANAWAGGVIQLLPVVTTTPGLLPLSVAPTPTTNVSNVGATVEILITVTDATSHAAIAGATVLPALSPGAVGSLSPSTAEKTNVNGVAFFNFTSTATGSVLATFAATALKYGNTTTSVALSVVAKSSTGGTTPGATTSSGLGNLDYLLLAIIVLLLVLLIVALILGRKRREEPSRSSSSGGAAAAEAGSGATLMASGAADTSSKPSSDDASEPPAEPAAGSSDSAEPPAETDKASEPKTEGGEDTSPVHVDESSEEGSGSGSAPESGSGSSSASEPASSSSESGPSSAEDPNGSGPSSFDELGKDEPSSG